MRVIVTRPQREAQQWVEDLRRQGIDVVWRYEISGFAIGDELRHGPHISANAGEPEMHGFDVRDAESLEAGRETKQVGGAI